ncbi:hypothetical protein [Streptomyces hydrogenans]|uniref:hypothetical protein n=1 Tax=Streptomyces hydrogenans TaxID=1873719 RepID=UPI00342C9E86
MPKDHFVGATEATCERADRIAPLAAGPDGPWRPSIRCYGVRRPDGRVTLADTGMGPVGSPASGWAPVPGLLSRVLADVGIETGDVDTVVLTSLHEDHHGWVVETVATPKFPVAGAP